MTLWQRLSALLGFGRSSAAAPAVVVAPEFDAPYKVQGTSNSTSNPEAPSAPLPVPVAVVGDVPAPLVLAAGARFAAALNHTLREEGGFVNHPSDPGGATNLGITLATLSDWRGRPVTVEQVRALGVEEARAIYRARYWNPIRGDDLPAGLDLALFDFAVNSGPGRAVRTLQRIVGVSADGAVGPMTLEAIRLVSPRWLAGELCDQRLAFLRGLDTWKVFGRGWEARVGRVRKAALE